MANVLPLPISGSGESAQELLLEQRDVLVRVENVLERSYSRLDVIQDVVTQSLGIQKQQLAMFQRQLENQEFANEEARREAARMRAGGGIGPSGATAETTTEGGGTGFGALPALATGAIAGGLAGSSLGKTLRGLAGRLLKGGGLIAIGNIFGEQIGKFLGDEAAAILQDLGASPEFANQVSTAISDNAQSAIVGAGISKLFLGRTLPGLIAGIIWNQLDLSRIFTPEGRDDILQGVTEWFERAREGTLTPEDIVNGGLTGAAAAYTGRKIAQLPGKLTPRLDTKPATPSPQKPGVRPRRPNGQFMSDAEIEQEAQRIKNAKLRRAFVKVFKALGVVGIVVAFVDVYRIIDIMNGPGTEDEKIRLIAPILGGLIGGLGGAALGAYIGALGGPWGALGGGVLGGLMGSLAGPELAVLLLNWALDNPPPVAPAYGYGGYENMTQEDILRQYAPEALPPTPPTATPEPMSYSRTSSEARPIQAAFSPSLGDANMVKASLGTGSQSTFIDGILETIRLKESNGDYSAYNFAWDEYVNSGGRKGSSATGAYQFIKGTWRNLTNKYGIGQQYEFARDAPANVQDEIARRYVMDILRENNGDISVIPNVWYTGNAAGIMSESALATNRGMAAAKYQADWLSRYAQVTGGNTPPAVTPPPQSSDIAAAQSMMGDSTSFTSTPDSLFGTGTLYSFLTSGNPEAALAQRLSNIFNRGVTPGAINLNQASEGAATAPVVINAPQINNDNSVNGGGGGGGTLASQERAISPIQDRSVISTMSDWYDATMA